MWNRCDLRYLGLHPEAGCNPKRMVQDMKIPTEAELKASSAPRKKAPLCRPLFLQILIAVIAGFTIGQFRPSVPVGGRDV